MFLGLKFVLCIVEKPVKLSIEFSLQGCCVQLQVKNGKCYEGILKTCSPKVTMFRVS